MYWICIGYVLEIYWRCIGDMMFAKIRILFESSKYNTRNFVFLRELRRLRHSRNSDVVFQEDAKNYRHLGLA